jgi:hypothetical protein
LIQHLLQGIARDVLHYEVVEPSFTFDPINRDDVWVIQLGRGLGFLMKARNQLGVIRHVRRKNLDGHPPFQHQVLCQEYDGHASTA